MTSPREEATGSAGLVLAPLWQPPATARQPKAIHFMEFAIRVMVRLLRVFFPLILILFVPMPRTIGRMPRCA
jgi:hypothetical protein